MADYTVTAANVMASPYALYFAPNVLSISATPNGARPNANIAGSTITAGQPVYQDTTTQLFNPADANGASPLYDVVGIAVNNATAGQPLSIVTYDPQFQPGITTLLVGDVVCISATAGKLCPSSDNASGMFVGIVGLGTSTTTMFLFIHKAGVVKA